MNKLIRIFFSVMVLLFIHFLAYAQEAEPVIAKVRYKFYHMKDTNVALNISQENTILYLGKKATLYKSYDRMMHDSVNSKKKIIAGKIEPSGNLGSGSQVILYTNSKSAYQVETIMSKYIFPIDYPVINWRIAKDTMTIEGLKCRMATGSWRGRDYIVWYCPQIPFRSGPWKLVGLPGLILKASDTKKQVMFEFDGFQNYNGPDKIVAPDKAISTTFVQYNKIHEAFLDNPLTFIKNSVPGITSITTGSPYVRKKPINNPLELTK